jgi:hypothetical protein
MTRAAQGATNPAPGVIAISPLNFLNQTKKKKKNIKILTGNHSCAQRQSREFPRKDKVEKHPDHSSHGTRQKRVESRESSASVGSSFRSCLEET